MTRLSIVIPNYNHARFLGESLGSVRAQRRPPDEVIVIDDASEDDSLAVIESESAGLPGFRLVRHDERRGVIATLNEGLELATGDHIGFLGADDYLAPEFAGAAGALLNEYPEAAFCCACAGLVGSGGGGAGFRPIVWPRTRAGYVAPSEFGAMLRGIDNLFIGTVMLYRRAALREIGGFDANHGSLADGVAARILAARRGFCFIPRVLGFWRIADRNLSVRAATSPGALSEIVASARGAIERDAQARFPEGYGALFERRMRFGGARLVALDPALPPAERARTVGELAEASRRERAFLAVFSRLGALGRFATMAWLALRLRPYSFWRLGFEPLRRLAASQRQRRD